jgi:Holliday junction resolvase
MRSNEGKIQDYVREKMEKKGWIVVKIIQSSLNGWPDLQCHKNGETVFIECKSGDKDADPLQSIRHAHLRKQGFKVLLINESNYREWII